MKAEDVVLKIIGEIYPVGKTETDSERFENLKVWELVFKKLFDELTDIVHYKKDAYEASVIRIRDKAKEIVEDTCADWFYEYYKDYFKKHLEELTKE